MNYLKGILLIVFFLIAGAAWVRAWLSVPWSRMSNPVEWYIDFTYALPPAIGRALRKKSGAGFSWVQMLLVLALVPTILVGWWAASMV